jgi:ABC-2 type transport system ATP-binding protein
MSEAIHAARLSKRFVDGSEPVHDVTLSVRYGRVHGLLGGPNSGKSTALGLLSTLLEPTSGEVQVDGLDAVRYPELVRDRIGIAFDRLTADPALSARQNLEQAARASGMGASASRGRVPDLLERLDLGAYAGLPAGKFPAAAGRRLEIALATVRTPPVLFVDEPTQGIPGADRARVWEFLREIARVEGTAVFVTTRSFSEAQSLCDRISVLQGGRVDGAEVRSRSSPAPLPAPSGPRGSFGFAAEGSSEADRPVPVEPVPAVAG